MTQKLDFIPSDVVFLSYRSVDWNFFNAQTMRFLHTGSIQMLAFICKRHLVNQTVKTAAKLHFFGFRLEKSNYSCNTDSQRFPREFIIFSAHKALI